VQVYINSTRLVRISQFLFFKNNKRKVTDKLIIIDKNVCLPYENQPIQYILRIETDYKQRFVSPLFMLFKKFVDFCMWVGHLINLKIILRVRSLSSILIQDSLITPLQSEITTEVYNIYILYHYTTLLQRYGNYNENIGHIKDA
jgi:hypothetical protein